MDKNQSERYSKGEKQLMKQFVESREDAVLILRNHFLQFEMLPEEKEFLRNQPKVVLDVIKKVFFVEPGRDNPVKWEASMYSGLSTLESSFSLDAAMYQIKATDILVKYSKQQCEALTENKEPEIILSKLTEPIDDESFDAKEDRVINMMAFNKIMPLLAGRANVFSDKAKEFIEEDSSEVKKKKAEKDSTK